MTEMMADLNQISLNAISGCLSKAWKKEPENEPVYVLLS